MFDIHQDRFWYSDFLQPDQGYTLDFAVGMTYSLNLGALLGVPVSMQEMGDMDSPIIKSPFHVLEAIRKSSEKFVLFCNCGGISLPQDIRSVYSLLENSVFEVKLPGRANFHPKLWILQQSNEDKKQKIKIVVLSRNLTFDNSIDLVVSMTGSINKAKRNKNQPIADILAFVAEHCSNEDKKNKVIALSKDVMRVTKFDIQSSFEDYEFISLGVKGVNGNKIDLFTDVRDAFVVSPFLSKDIMEKLTQGGGMKTLITRQSSITKDTIDRFKEVYAVKEVLVNNEYTQQDIHAKLYFTSGKKGNNLYIGSANCSHNAFYRNVEFLLKLTFTPYKGSYDMIRKEFLPVEHSPYERIEMAPPIEENKEKEELINNKRLCFRILLNQ